MIRRNGVPEVITIGRRDAQAAAIKRAPEAHATASKLRQIKDLANMVEQDHRAVKRIMRPLLVLQSCAAAHATLVGIALLHMLKKRQLVIAEGGEGLTAAEPCYALAAESPHQQGQLTSNRLHTKICDRAPATSVPVFSALAT